MAASSSRFRVLVVDDDRALAESIAAILADEFAVTMTTSAVEALRLIESQSFEVLCADYRMPVHNGHELIRRAALRPDFVSCLLVTGAEEYFLNSETKDHYVLLKPFSPARLLALVQQLAQVAHMRRSVSALTAAQTGRFKAVR